MVQNTQTITIKRNNKLCMGAMARQALIRSLYALSDGWDVFLVKSGRIAPQSGSEEA